MTPSILLSKSWTCRAAGTEQKYIFWVTVYTLFTCTTIDLEGLGWKPNAKRNRDEPFELAKHNMIYYALEVSSMKYYYIPVHVNTALLSSHRGCSKDKIRPTLVLRPSTILSLCYSDNFEAISGIIFIIYTDIF